MRTCSASQVRQSRVRGLPSRPMSQSSKLILNLTFTSSGGSMKLQGTGISGDNILHIEEVTNPSVLATYFWKFFQFHPGLPSLSMSEKNKRGRFNAAQTHRNSAVVTVDLFSRWLAVCHESSSFASQSPFWDGNGAITKSEAVAHIVAGSK